MHSEHPSAEMHKLHVEFDQPLPSDLVPDDSLSDIGAFDDSINITDTQVSAVTAEESASNHLQIADEKRLPDFLLFAYVLHEPNNWTQHVLLIVEIKDLPFVIEGYDAVTYQEMVRAEIEEMYLQVRTQAQLVFHEHPRQNFIRALCVVGLFWKMIEFTRDRLPPLPACRIWDQDMTNVIRKEETTLSTRMHGIFSDNSQTDYNSVLKSRFRETFKKFQKSVPNLD